MVRPLPATCKCARGPLVGHWQILAERERESESLVLARSSLKLASFDILTSR